MMGETPLLLFLSVTVHASGLDWSWDKAGFSEGKETCSRQRELCQDQSMCRTCSIWAADEQGGWSTMREEQRGSQEARVYRLRARRAGHGWS
jgi:hypothetical protein